MYSWKMNSFSNYSLPKSQINFNPQFYSSSSQENCPKPQFYLINFPLPFSCYNYCLPPNHDSYQVNQPPVTNQARSLQDQASQQDKNLLLPVNKLDKKNGNVKANIVRDFIRGIKKDASAVLLAKNTIGSQFSVKKFMEILLKNFPNQNKYLRFKKIQQLCSIKEDPQFSKLLRIVYANFMRLNYKCLVLAKKKNKLEYLRACRQMMENLSEVIN